jgi:penicillin-binding protein 2
VIKRAMVGVNKEGTGARAFAGAPTSPPARPVRPRCSPQGRRVQGRQWSRRSLRDHALFIAFAPADKPKIALAVLVENGGFGAQSAAPIARMVLDYYLLGKLPKGRQGREAAVEGDEE